MIKSIGIKVGGLVLASISSILVVAAIASSTVHAAPTPVNLGTASPFAILAGTPNITDAGNTSVIVGNVGLSPATGAAIDLDCNQVTGIIYSVDAGGPSCRVTNPTLLTSAKADLTAAYIDVAARTPVTTITSNELGGRTLVAGVYDSGSGIFDISAGAGELVLNGAGDPSSVFIFQSNEDGTGLVVGPGSSIRLENGAQACNIYWRVDTATIDTTANFKGNILALNSITVANGATIEGRLLARDGSVTLDNDEITVPTCITTGDDDDDDTGVGVIPGFPNTGSLETSTIVWGAIASASIILGISLVIVARKKHLL